MGRYLILAISLTLIVSVSFWLFKQSRSINQVDKINFDPNKLMKIESIAFENGGLIPGKYTCDGDNTSPELRFSNIPEKTESLALIVHDPDAPKHIREDGIWDHWLIWDMPVEVNGIGEGESSPGTVGSNTNGDYAYGGPCPPDREHRYFFTLYALDTKLDLNSQGITRSDLLETMNGHILEEAVLMGRYNKDK